jgi:HTH-type transcriptional regulator/antitoxin HigA
MHELGHIFNEHVTAENKTVIFDDTNSINLDKTKNETEADLFANEALIPANKWAEIKDIISFNKNKKNIIQSLSAEFNINAAIIAGRWRWETSDYKSFTSFIGQGKIKPLFINAMYE